MPGTDEVDFALGMRSVCWEADSAGRFGRSDAPGQSSVGGILEEPPPRRVLSYSQITE